jgi:hypothetical protein
MQKAMSEGEGGEKEHKANATTVASKLPQRGIDHHGGDVMSNSTVNSLFFASFGFY